MTKKTEWSYLPNASHIDSMIASVKAHPEQEPVAWMSDTGSVASLHEKEEGYVLQSAFNIPLYAALPAAQRPWVGLSAQEAAECWTTSATQTWRNFEDKLKEKNT